MRVALAEVSPNRKLDRCSRSRCTRAGFLCATSRQPFTDTSGKSLLSKSAVSQITERLWTDYQAFAGRDLAESFGVLIHRWHC